MKKIVVFFSFATTFFVLIIIGLYYLICNQELNEEKNDSRSMYLKDSDYYIKGAIIEIFDLAQIFNPEPGFYNAMVIKVDSIDIKKISKKRYGNVHNSDTSMVIVYSNGSMDHFDLNNNYYIEIDSKNDTIIYQNFKPKDSFNKHILPIDNSLYEASFWKFTKSKSGTWIKF